MKLGKYEFIKES